MARAGLFICRRKATAQEWLDSEGREKICSHQPAAENRRLALFGDRELSEPVTGDSIKRSLLRYPIPIIRPGSLALLGNGMPTIGFPDLHESVGPWIRQGFHQRGVDDGKYRGVHADSERQSKNRDYRESRTLAQYAQAVTQVTRQMVHPIPSPHVAPPFPQFQSVAESALRRGTRFSIRCAGSPPLSLAKFPVQTHLFIQFAIESRTAKKYEYSPPVFSEPFANGGQDSLLPRSIFVLGRLDDPRYRLHHSLKLRYFRFHLLAAQWSQPVVPRPAVFRSDAPVRLHPPFQQHPLQRGIQRPFLNAQHFLGHLLNRFRDLEPVHFLAAGQSPEDQHVQGPGGNLIFAQCRPPDIVRLCQMPKRHT